MAEFIVMSGVSGSGKSTWAENYKANQESFGKKYKIISTDAIRKEILGSEENQADGKKIFEIAFSRISKSLKNKENVIFDATNLVSKNRRAIINKFRNIFGVKFICVYMNTSLKDCLARQNLRKRKVPNEVVSRQMLKSSVPIYEEGWDKIIIIVGENASEEKD